jgi:NADP-dependent 3-hydroxy acid dehydrogenase YdfG
VDRQTVLAKDGTDFKIYKVDVRDFTDVQRVVTETVGSYGHLDLISNNAGLWVGDLLEERGVDDPLSRSQPSR